MKLLQFKCKNCKFMKIDEIFFTCDLERTKDSYAILFFLCVKYIFIKKEKQIITTKYSARCGQYSKIIPKIADKRQWLSPKIITLNNILFIYL